MQGPTADSLSQGDAPVAAESVRAQLARVLASDGFVSSHRLCRFLRFIVERTLENDLARLKEFVVAMEVFDRDEKYDPAIDSIVRVEARRLRAKLKAYYEGPGSGDLVHIDLRPGSYVPVFRPLASNGKSVPAAVSQDSAQYTAVAVLPFVNMSPEPDQDYFCDGITEEIINALAAVDNLRVVARTSVFQFKGQAIDLREVGQRLGVQVVVEGSVRKAGNQLRITAQAIDAGKGYHLWSDTYRRELHDVFAIQEEISTAIAETMRTKLPARVIRPAARQPSLDAYNGFFQALHLVHQKNVDGIYAAIAQFEDLIRRFPDYADPYAGIATAHAVLSLAGVISGKEALPELRRKAEQAVSLNPESAAAWTVLAGISAHWEFDWQEAGRRFRKAISLQPSNYAAHSWYGMVLAMMGRFREADAELETALKLDPLGASSYSRKGTLAYLKGDDAEALACLSQSLLLAPDFPDSRLVLGLIYLRHRNYPAAIEVLSRNLDQLRIPAHLGALAGAYASAGRVSECQRLLADLDSLAQRQYVSPLARAFASLGMNDLDGALDALTAAIEDRAIFVGLLAVDPLYEPLRRAPRYGTLLARLNLSPL